jgi:hypothetical protein
MDSFYRSIDPPDDRNNYFCGHLIFFGLKKLFPAGKNYFRRGLIIFGRNKIIGRGIFAILNRRYWDCRFMWGMLVMWGKK